MKPTVGRIVHYITVDKDHRAAIVTDVSKDGDWVTLAIFIPLGLSWNNARYCNPEEDKVETWHWPEMKPEINDKEIIKNI